MKVARVLGSAFKPGGFKKVIRLWLFLCVATGVGGKLMGNAILMWVGPLTISFAVFFILWLIYRALGGREKEEDGPNYFN